MIRVLLGSALPVLGLGVAAAFFAPNLLIAPHGEPLIMASPADATLQPATFEGETCPSTLLFAGSSGDADVLAGTRIVAFALRSSEQHVAVTVEDFSGDGSSRTIVLVFDDEGHLVAAGDPASLNLALGAKIVRDCPPDAAAPI